MKQDEFFLARWYKKARFMEIRNRIKLQIDVGQGTRGQTAEASKLISWMENVKKYGFGRVSNQW